MSDDSSSRDSTHLPTTITPFRKRRTMKSTVNTHRIGHWTIQESLEPFTQKEQPHKSDVHQWNINDVCSFVEQILGDNRYTPILQEHLIDGIALLLLQEEHLTKFFQMPSKQRRKLLHQIDQFQI